MALELHKAAQSGQLERMDALLKAGKVVIDKRSLSLSPSVSLSFSPFFFSLHRCVCALCVCDVYLGQGILMVRRPSIGQRRVDVRPPFCGSSLTVLTSMPSGWERLREKEREKRERKERIHQESFLSLSF